MVWMNIYVIVLALLVLGGGVRSSRTKQSVLLAASYLFYGTFGTTFLAMLIASSIFNFAMGVWLKRRPTAARLWIGISVNVGLLSLFKYLPAMNAIHQIAMPIGMSFWTFQAMSYLFDIYRAEQLDESLVEFCLYMAFWPTVLMGPVCRLSYLLPQFRDTSSVQFSDLTEGINRIGLGLFMKLVLAQLLASGVDAGFIITRSTAESTHHWGGLDVWFLAIGFGFQLFFDFAGYSHISIGAARLFGFRITENFDAPFLATTPSIFWSKWHISLSSWIRDYVFVPFATVRRQAWWRYFALWLSMVLFGLWHGSKFTYVIWGAYQGVLLVAHRIGQQLKRKSGFEPGGPIGRGLSWIATFLTISLGWIAFRANDLNQTSAMLRAVLSPHTYRNAALSANYYFTVLGLACGYFAVVNSPRFFVRVSQGSFSQRIIQSRIFEPVQLLWRNAWLWMTPTIVFLATLWMLTSFTTVDVRPFVYSGF